MREYGIKIKLVDECIYSEKLNENMILNKATKIKKKLGVKRWLQNLSFF